MKTMKFAFSLKKLVDGKKEIQISEDNLIDAIKRARETYPMLGNIIDETGNITKNTNVIINNELIEHKELTEIALKQGDEIVFIPTIVGG